MTDILKSKATKIKLIILDVDGVLTNGLIWFNPDGSENKSFNTQDGHGLKTAMSAGIAIAIISGNSSYAVTQRMQNLKIEHVYQGQQDKRYAFDDLLAKLNLQPSQVAYMGDDIPDISLMKKVGLSIAVNNAVPQVKAIATWQTKHNGGEGAVREACDLILEAQQH